MALNILTLPAARFRFLKTISNKYALLLIGSNLSKVSIDKGLRAFDKDKDVTKLAQLFKAEDIRSVGLIKKTSVSIFEQEMPIIQQKVNLKLSHFVVLLDYKDPNIRSSQHNLPSEEAFLISSNEFARFYERDISTGLCYYLMLKVLEEKNRIDQILSHQLGHPNPYIFPLPNQVERAEIIMPHRGNLEELETALWYLNKQTTTPQKISVCFDEFVTEQHFKIADKHTKARFFVNFPSGVGPYPSRDVLARGTEENMIVFHDSDDVSTTNRIGILTNILKTENIDAVGSHELRVDKIKKRIEAKCYPLDVIGAKNNTDLQCIFFPSTAIKKSAYLKVGGLSTIRKHSSDSQFYWRAHFFLNIKNVDEFLYIRVKQENTLTTAPETALDTKVRIRLNRQWYFDFARVQNQNVELLESALVDEYNVAEIDVVPLQKEYREMIINWQDLKLSLRDSNPFKHLKKPTFPNENDILESRLLDYREVKDAGVTQLKKSMSWRIGWAITRCIIVLFGWIPFVKKRI